MTCFYGFIVLYKFANLGGDFTEREVLIKLLVICNFTYTSSQSRNLFDRMVSKVEKIKIEDESNGNVSPTIHDTTDNTSTAAKEVDNSFEDDEQVQLVSLASASYIYNLDGTC